MQLTHCRWCLKRNVKREMFCVKNGPSEFWFCGADCAAKFVYYRHVIGASHVLKMTPKDRVEYLEGETIDQYISNRMKRG